MMKEQGIYICLHAIYKSSNNAAIISAYRKYRELLGLPRYPERWYYYNGDSKMQKAMYLSLLDDIYK